MPNKSIKYLETNDGEKCIQNVITKHSDMDDCMEKGSTGDLPSMKN